MKRPFFAAGFTLLITLLSTAFLGLSTAAKLLPAVFVVCGLAACRDDRKRAGCALAALCCCAGFILYGAAFSSYTEALRNCGEFRNVEGSVIELPYIQNGKYKVVVRTTSIDDRPVKTDITLSLPSDPDISAGALVSAERITLYPSGSTSDKSRITAMAKGRYIAGYAGFTGRIKFTAAAKKTLYAHFVDLRAAIAENISDHMNSAEAGVLTGMLLGKTDGMTAADRAAFRGAGISHLFAVSGLHLTMWAGAVFFIFGRRKKYRVLPNVISLLFVLFFAALTGFTPSVCRAGVMVAMAYAGNMLFKRADALNSIGLALCAMLIIKPFSAADPSLLLSVSATLALVLLLPPLTERSRALTARIGAKGVRAAVNALLTPILISLSAMLFTIPAAAYYFGSVPAAAPIANLLCVLPAEAAMFLGVFGLLTSFSSGLCAPFFNMSALVIDYMRFVCTKLTSWGHSSIPLTGDGVKYWFFGTVFVLAVVFVFVRRYKRPMLAVTALSAACLTLILGAGAVRRSGQTSVVLFPAGNNSCVLVTYGNREAALIGCGGSYRSTDLIAGYLDTEGIDNVSYFLVPRTAQTESGRLAELKAALSPRRVIAAQAGIDGADGADILPSGSITLDGDTEILWNTDGSSSYARVVSGTFSAQIYFYPASAAGNEAPDADVLITRAAIPAGVDRNDFDHVIVESDTGADDGNIRITQYGGSPAAVIEVKNGKYRLTVNR